MTKKNIHINSAKIPYDDYTIHSYHCHPNRPCSCIQDAVSYGFKELHILSKAKIVELSANQRKIIKKRFLEIIDKIAKCGEPKDGEHLQLFMKLAEQLECKEKLRNYLSKN